MNGFKFKEGSGDLVFRTTPFAEEDPGEERVRLSPDPEQAGDWIATRDGVHLGHVCSHVPGVIRVGFDWGEGLAMFNTIEEAAEFLAELKP